MDFDLVKTPVHVQVGDIRFLLVGLKNPVLDFIFVGLKIILSLDIDALSEQAIKSIFDF